MTAPAPAPIFVPWTPTPAPVESPARRYQRVALLAARSALVAEIRADLDDALPSLLDAQDLETLIAQATDMRCRLLAAIEPAKHEDVPRADLGPRCAPHPAPDMGSPPMSASAPAPAPYAASWGHRPAVDPLPLVPAPVRGTKAKPASAPVMMLAPAPMPPMAAPSSSQGVWMPTPLVALDGPARSSAVPAPMPPCCAPPATPPASLPMPIPDTSAQPSLAPPSVAAVPLPPAAPQVPAPTEAQKAPAMTPWTDPREVLVPSHGMCASERRAQLRNFKPWPAVKELAHTHYVTPDGKPLMTYAATIQQGREVVLSAILQHEIAQGVLVDDVGLTV